MRIRVRIERVVLDGAGVDWRDRRAFETALHAELAGRLGMPGAAVPEGDARIRRLDAPPVPLAAAPGRAGAADLGSAVGRSVHAAVGRAGRA